MTRSKLKTTSKLGFALLANDVDITAPLLYRILVKGSGDANATTIYVGQTVNGCGRPFDRYDLNLRRLLHEKPPLNGRAYRPVHFDLRAAYAAGHEISIDLVRNVDLLTERIAEAERDLQAQFGVEPNRKGERRVLDDDGMLLGFDA
jgi:hypothetical protein